MRSSLTHQRLQRRRRVRAKISGTAQRPRMSVCRSLTRMTVQLIDDDAKRTLCAASTAKEEKPNVAAAEKLGTRVAKAAQEKGISAVVFDRSIYAYHGRIRAVADAARKVGLQF